MHEFRRWLNAVNETNASLTDYFSHKPVDMESHDIFEHAWHAFVHEYLNAENQEKLTKYLGKSLDEIDVWDYDALPATAQRMFADFLEDQRYDQHVMHDDPHGAPAWMHMEHLADLPPRTWLLHFTEHGDAIVADGFTKGVEDINQIGLTRLNSILGNMERRTGDNPGFNFAYLAKSKIDFDLRVGGYGNDAIMFRSGGVHVYHAGDREEQVVFYGPDVDRKSMLLLRDTPNGWRVKRLEEVIFRAPTLNACVKWVARR